MVEGIHAEVRDVRIAYELRALRCGAGEIVYGVSSG